MIQHRPKLRLRAPKSCAPGAEHRLEVVVDARRPVRVERLDVILEGREATTAGQVLRSLLRLEATVATDRTFAPGRSELPVRFALPPDLPPSYEGVERVVRYTVAVQAGLGWWPGANARFLLNVPSLAVPDPAMEAPYVFSTRPGGPRGAEAHLEGSLGARVLRGGQVLEGRLAFRNVASHRWDATMVALVAQEVIGRRVLPARRFTLTLDPPRADGEPVPFRMRVPEGLGAGFEAEHVTHRWVVELGARRRFGADLRVAVPVVVDGRPRKDGESAPRFAAPAVGNPRVDALWRRVAEGTALRLEEGRLVGEAGAVRLVLEREDRGREGRFLVATLDGPELGLDLDGGTRGSFRRSARPATLRRAGGGYLAGRDARQVEAFAREVLAPVPLPRGVQLVDVHDGGLRLEQRDGGVRRAPLMALAKAGRLLAEQLDAFPALCPLPGPFAGEAAGWEALAAELQEGRFLRGPVRVEGRLGGAAVSVATEWTPEGQPIRTVAAVRPEPPPAPSAHLLAGPSLRDAPGWGELPATAKELVEALRADGTLRIDGRALLFGMPAPLRPPRRALGTLRRLLELLRTLRGERGPYR